MKLFNKTALTFVSFTVLTIIIVSVLMFETLKVSFEETLLENTFDVVAQKKSNMDSYLETISQQSKAISKIPQTRLVAFDNGISTELKNSVYLDSHIPELMRMHDDIMQLRILDINGHEIFRYDSVDGTPVKTSQENLQDKSNRDYFINAQNTPFYLSDITLNEEHGEVQTPHVKMIRTVVPITDIENQITSFLVVNYDIGKVLNSLFDSQSGTTVIFDQDGNFVLHDDVSKEFGTQLNTGINYFDEQPEFKENLSLMDRKKHEDDESEEFRIWQKIFLDDEDHSRYLVVASIVPYSVVFGTIYELQQNLTVIVSVSVLFIVFVTILISRHITDPIKDLVNGLRRVEKGDLSIELKKQHSDEIGDLADSFNLMVQSLKQSKIMVDEYDSLLEEQVRDYSTLNNVVEKTIMVSKTDPQGRITYANDIFCKSFGFTLDELVGKTHNIIKSEYHPKAFFKKMWETISTGEIWSGEIKNQTKTGNEIWVFSSISPNIDSNGRILEYISLKIDITKMKQAEQTLIESNQKLQALDTAKQEFSAMVSHELKTPLTPILTYCDILKESKDNLSEIEQECVDEIEQNVRKLTLLVSDILDAHKLDLNKLRFRKNSFVESSVIDDVIKDLLPVAKQKEIQLIKRETANKMLNSDNTRIYQVLSNLIKNALDFVPQGNGIIEVGSSEKAGSIEFYVKDNGVGIPEKKISKLFRKFYQIDSATNRSHGGNGLGLVICKGIVEGLGGKIWLKSKVDCGATFYFSIPLEQESLVIKNE